MRGALDTIDSGTLPRVNARLPNVAIRAGQSCIFAAPTPRTAAIIGGLVVLLESAACNGHSAAQSADASPTPVDGIASSDALTSVDGMASVDGIAPSDGGGVPDSQTLSDAGDVDATADGGAAESADGATVGTLCGNCPTGTKNCSSLCFPTDTPYFGCGIQMDCEGVPFVHATMGCDAQGNWAIQSCDASWLDCDGNVFNGCETLVTTPQNCGACGQPCGGGQVCAKGACATSCPFPLTDCSGTCADLTTDNQNCGSCGMVCGNDNSFMDEPSCLNATCSHTCRPGSELFNGRCIDPLRDPSACGPQHAQCPIPAQNQTAECINGVCEMVCPLGWTDCGACVYLGGDPNNCGACNNACAGNDLCVGGQCVSASSLVIAASLNQPEDVLVDGTDLFFTTLGDSAVNRTSTTGGMTSVLATGQANPVRLALDATYVYWSSNLGGSIARTLRTGSGSIEVVASANKPWGLVVDDTYVYWFDPAALDTGIAGDGAILRAPKAGGGPVVPIANVIGNGATKVDLTLYGDSLLVGDQTVPTPNGLPLSLPCSNSTGGPGCQWQTSPGQAISGSVYYGALQWKDLSNPPPRYGYGGLGGTFTSVMFFEGAAANSCGLFQANISGSPVVNPIPDNENGIFLSQAGFGAPIHNSCTVSRSTAGQTACAETLQKPQFEAPIAITLGNPRRLVLDSGFLYYTDATAGTIYKVPVPN